jgi:hypothetical protein
MKQKLRSARAQTGARHQETTIAPATAGYGNLCGDIELRIDPQEAIEELVGL